jgi:5-amino-6-(5-phosphoribosylamino)uracil reductase
MKITCHMISSVDGRLLPAYWSPQADPSVSINQVYESVAKKFQAQGWIVGRRTMAEFTDIVEEKEPLEGTRTMHTGTFVGAREGRPLAVVFDATGKLHYKTPTLPTGEHIVAVLGSHVTRAYQKELEEVGVSYIVRTPGSHREETINALQALERDFGVTHLLLEGGGVINGSFIQMGLVDELSVVVYPGVDGKAGRPSIIECREEAYERPAEGSKLTLLNCEKLEGGYVWLDYKIDPA